MDPVVIGVDGGGTYSRLVAVDGQGRVVGRSTCGSLNYNNLDIARCRAHLKEGVERALADCGASGYSRIAVGLSALSEPATAQERDFFAGDVFPPEKLLLDSDVFMALMGATQGEPGLMIISGTGTMSVALDAGGGLHQSGGWGYLLGDEGSCYYIAYRGLLCAIHQEEGWGPPTAITGQAKEYFELGEDLRGLIGRLYSPLIPVSDLAAFAHRVLSCAAQGDEQAGIILADTLGVLRGNAGHLMRFLPEQVREVHVYGGLFEHNPKVMHQFERLLDKDYPGVTVALPRFQPELGAVIHHFRDRGEWDAQKQRNMEATQALVQAAP